MSRAPARRAAGALCFVCTSLGVPLATAGATPAPPATRIPAAPPITGVVKDESGRPLPNVAVVVTEAGRSTTTAADGTFALRGLAAGTYHLSFLVLGYTPGHVAVVVPETGAPVRIAVTLTSTTVRLQTAVITATPTGTDPMTITQATAELSGKALSRNLGASVAQTLSNEPGLAMRYNGPASVPVIRGLTGERILVLQDGQRAADLSSASSDHALSVDPLNAQRIEVVRGPASLLYGNSALGGVVNVISNDIPTEVPSHLEGYVGSQAESVNPGGAVSTGLTVPVARHVAVTGRFNARSLDDVRAGGDVRQLGTFSRNQGAVVGLGVVGVHATGGAAYRGQRFEYGLPTASGDPEEGSHIRGQRNEGVGRLDVNIDHAGIETVRFDGTAQWYRHDEIENTGAIGTSFDLKTQTLNATARTLWAPGFKGALGVSGLFKQYASTGEEALTPAANSTGGGVFLYQEVPLSAATTDTTAESLRAHLQFGGRYDVYHITTLAGAAKFGPARARTFTNVSGSFGASTPLGRHLTLSGSLARAFRAPTVEELYSNAFHAAVGTYDVGNPNLRAEVNTGVDGILRARSGRTSVQLSAYANRIANYIAPNLIRDTTLADEGSVPLNVYAQRDATMHGVEGQLEVQMVRHFVIGAVGDVVRGRFVSGGALPFLPSGRLGGSLRWDTGRWYVGGDVKHGFAQTRVSQPGCARADEARIGPGGTLPTDPTTSTPCVDVATPAYALLNLNAGATWLVRGLSHSLTVRVDNVGDTRYYDASSRIKSFTANPGRNVSVVYKLLY